MIICGVQKALILRIVSKSIGNPFTNCCTGSWILQEPQEEAVLGSVRGKKVNMGSAHINLQLL